jgi:hypothetical protein
MIGARTRRTRIVLASVIVLATAYWAADNHVVFGPKVSVRNETASVAFVDVVGYGDDKLSVPPWQAGMCNTASWTWHHHGDPQAAGNGTALMSAEPGSTTYEPLTQFAADRPLYLRIDATGAVRTGEPVPDDAPGCTQYSVRSGWSWFRGQ